MTRFILTFCLLIIFIACKSDHNKQNISDAEIKSLTIAQKIANEHGYNNWGKVSRIDFVFNVDRDTIHFERSWQWEPKANTVVMISEDDTIAYNRTQIDSTNINADKAFINDKYWLLAPFNLVWDKDVTLSDPVKDISPIGKKQLNKITLTYSNLGGYTPGDAYDFYYDDNFLIKEWIFRRANTNEPTLITTWEDYKVYNGIKIAMSHNRLETDGKLYFSNVKVTLE